MPSMTIMKLTQGNMKDLCSKLLNNATESWLNTPGSFAGLLQSPGLRTSTYNWSRQDSKLPAYVASGQNTPGNLNDQKYTLLTLTRCSFTLGKDDLPSINKDELTSLISRQLQRRIKLTLQNDLWNSWLSSTPPSHSPAREYSSLFSAQEMVS